MDEVNSARGRRAISPFVLDGLPQFELYDVYLVIVT